MAEKSFKYVIVGGGVAAVSSPITRGLCYDQLLSLLDFVCVGSDSLMIMDWTVCAYCI